MSTNEEMSVRVIAKFDTGVGSNLIREDVLPMAWLADIQPICVSVKAAGNTSFTVEGVVRLLVEVGGHEAKTIFGLVPKLAIKTIFDTAFINKKIDRAETKSRQNISRKGHAAAVVARFDDKKAVQSAGRSMMGLARITKSDTAVCLVVKA